MCEAPTDRSSDHRPIHRRNDVICFGAPITESSATWLRTERRIPKDRKVGARSPNESPNLHPVFLRHQWDDAIQAQILDKLSVMVGDVPDGNHRDAEFVVRSGVTAFDTVERI